MPIDFIDCNVADMCSGCGIQGLTAARRGAKHVTCIDMNPRAIRFATFNMTLNGFDHETITIVERNLLELDDTDVSIERFPFDIVLANPPYIAGTRNASNEANEEGLSTYGLTLFGDGGLRGEVVLSQICKLVSSSHWLKDGGSFYIVSNLVNVETYASRFISWWSCNEGYGCEAVLLHGKTWLPIEYASLILDNIPTTSIECQRYESELRKQEIHSVTNGFIIGRKVSKETSLRVEFITNEIWQELLNIHNNLDIKSKFPQ